MYICYIVQQVHTLEMYEFEKKKIIACYIFIFTAKFNAFPSFSFLRVFCLAWISAFSTSYSVFIFSIPFSIILIVCFPSSFSCFRLIFKVFKIKNMEKAKFMMTSVFIRHFILTGDFFLFSLLLWSIPYCRSLHLSAFTHANENLLRLKNKRIEKKKVFTSRKKQLQKQKSNID